IHMYTTSRATHIQTLSLHDALSICFSVTEDYHGTTMIDHGGSLQSISSKFAILPDEGVSAIVLTNLADFPAGRLLLMALNAYYGRSLDADHLGFEAIELSPE